MRRWQRAVGCLRHGPRTAGAVLAHVRRLPAVPIGAVLAGAPLLVAAPHPDDESLGAGGLIMAALEAGIPVHVVVVTDGAASHPGLGAASVAARRRAETLAAAAVLGLPAGSVTFLGVPDGAAPRRGTPARRIGERLAALAAEQRAGTVVTSWDFDPHPDHVATCALAARAARTVGAALFAYPVWAWTLPPRTLLPARPIAGFGLPVGRVLHRKRDAVMQHASQTSLLDGPDGQSGAWAAGFSLSPAHLEAMASSVEPFVAMNAAARRRLRP